MNYFNDVCLEPNVSDACPDDHFKRNTDDGCPCGETNVERICYKNIETVDDLIGLANKSDNYIIKAPIHLPEDFTAISGFTGILNGGKYLYESYWNKNIFDQADASWVDNTNETYTFNAEGIPVINDNTSVLNLLRFNSGHDGGVISTNIPERFKTATYDDWKAIDIDGYKIPVPESAYNLINN